MDHMDHIEDRKRRAANAAADIAAHLADGRLKESFTNTIGNHT